MPKLPLTVSKVVPTTGGTYAVTVVYADLTTQDFLVPDSLANAEAVRISAIAMAVLSDQVLPGPTRGSHKKWRWMPR